MTPDTTDKDHNILFSGKEHETFFLKALAKSRSTDIYHQALFYCIGISEDTRRHADQIYDYKTDCVQPECLLQGWITSGSARIVRLAFNLYCNGTPSVDENAPTEEQLRECRCYGVEEIFCCSYAPFFWQAVKIRYPEYV